MRLLLRAPLVSHAALATYLVVHVLVGVLHHHAAEPRPECTPLQMQAAGFADNEDDEDCLLCSVLHLAQMPATVLSLHAVTLHSGEAVSAASLIRPYPVETAHYSRGPPLR